MVGGTVAHKPVVLQRYLSSMSGSSDSEKGSHEAWLERLKPSTHFFLRPHLRECTGAVFIQTSAVQDPVRELAKSKGDLRQ